MRTHTSQTRSCRSHSRPPPPPSPPLLQAPSAFSELGAFAVSLAGDAYASAAPRLLALGRALRCEALALSLLPQPRASLSSVVPAILAGVARGALAGEEEISASW